MNAIETVMRYKYNGIEYETKTDAEVARASEEMFTAIGPSPFEIMRHNPRFVSKVLSEYAAEMDSINGTTRPIICSENFHTPDTVYVPTSYIVYHWQDMLNAVDNLIHPDNNQKVNAIKLVRSCFYGCSLKEAKDWVEARCK